MTPRMREIKETLPPALRLQQQDSTSFAALSSGQRVRKTEAAQKSKSPSRVLLRELLPPTPRGFA